MWNNGLESALLGMLLSSRPPGKDMDAADCSCLCPLVIAIVLVVLRLSV